MANTNQGKNQNQGGNNNQGSGSERGFASMDADRQREIAAEGGRAAHASGNAHEFNSEEARAAGAKSHGGGGNGAGNTRASSGSESGSGSGGTRGGTSEQHARAGSQSHKNDR